MCVIQIPLHVCLILTCIQFGVWIVSAGVFTCSWGKYGLYAEQYTRWALCFLAGGCILLYMVLVGILLGGAPHLDWADIVIKSTKSLLISDYEAIERLTPKEHYLDLDVYPSTGPLSNFLTLRFITSETRPSVLVKGLLHDVLVPEEEEDGLSSGIQIVQRIIHP
jgi:hypothetical protein